MWRDLSDFCSPGASFSMREHLPAPRVGQPSRSLLQCIESLVQCSACPPQARRRSCSPSPSRSCSTGPIGPLRDTSSSGRRSHALELTPENRGMVARYLHSTRVLRTWGGVAGALLPSLLEFARTGRVQVLGFGTDGDSAPLGFGTIFVGYLVGALYAEVSLARPPAGARRAASLARRELEDYLPRRVLVAQRALAGAGALGVLAIGLVPYAAAVSNPGLPTLAIVALGVLASGAGLEALERWLVRRPQPFTEPGRGGSGQRDPGPVAPRARRRRAGAVAPVLLRRVARAAGRRGCAAALGHGRPGGRVPGPVAGGLPRRGRRPPERPRPARATADTASA